MHEGGWEPFVHHFSSMLGGVVPQDEETRAGGISCTKLPRRPARHAAPPPVHTEVYKLPHDNKSVLKGNFFCGIILSPERNQRCNTGNNMKGDAI